MSVRILLEDIETGSYFVHPQKWTKNPTEAYAFPAGDKVVDRAFHLKIKKPAIFYQFRDATQNFSVPIPPAPH